MYLEEESLDDLLNGVYSSLLKESKPVRATKGTTVEEVGAFLRLTNPRARISASETRLKLLSALGEFMWYVAGSDDPSFISHYIPFYKDIRLADGHVPGAYGPRLFGKPPFDQFLKSIELLKRRPTSRRAVSQLYSAEDLALSLEPSDADLLDVPCTCTLQLLLREDRLHLIVHMRSNDAYKGLPHDVFCFTMLQELAARALNVELGHYTHVVGSLHLYEENRLEAITYLDEGWHQKSPMLPMPLGDQMGSVDSLVRVERQLRIAGDDSGLEDLPTYWRDIGLLLCAFNSIAQSHVRKHAKILRETRARVQCEVYKRYLQDSESNLGEE